MAFIYLHCVRAIGIEAANLFLVSGFFKILFELNVSDGVQVMMNVHLFVDSSKIRKANERQREK